MLYAEKLKLEKAYNDVAQFCRSVYKIKMTIKPEPTAMKRIVSLVDAVAAQNLINAAFISPQ